MIRTQAETPENFDQLKNDHHIALWLFIVCAMVFLMVIVGGITRLTESGLSMVTWHPISGILPPIGEVAWLAEFANYKKFPEYMINNEGMSLSEFKSIFYWEYAHRILGRLIGLVYFIPFVIFLIKKKVKASINKKLWLLFILGGCQGVLGWWMVKSGLVDEPDVSHYRLTAHLGLAVLIYAYALWLAFSLIFPMQNKKQGRPRILSMMLVKLIFIQILLGGLVAGTHAGKSYTDWPMMDGDFIPDGLMAISPWYMNFFENFMTIQFDHRMLAYLITGLGFWLWFKSAKFTENKIAFAAHLFIICLVFQVILGIVTLITAVAIHPAVMHQAGALMALSASIYLLNRVRS